MLFGYTLRGATDRARALFDASLSEKVLETRRMWNGEHEVLWSRAAGTRWTAPAKAILVFGANRPHPPWIHS